MWMWKRLFSSPTTTITGADSKLLCQWVTSICCDCSATHLSALSAEQRISRGAGLSEQLLIAAVLKGELEVKLLRLWSN